jgi:hypothetical protein
VLAQVLARRESTLMLPAGEMWSVVTLSPSTASTRAPRMSSTAPALARHVVEVRRLRT